MTISCSRRAEQPAAHCGCGEGARTGLHGANRLAGNSLLKAVVMAHRRAEAVDGYLRAMKREAVRISFWADLGGGTEDERLVVAHNWEQLHRAIWGYVGIIRATRRPLELRNLVQVAELIVACALQRREGRRLHATMDYSHKQKVARHPVVKKR